MSQRRQAQQLHLFHLSSDAESTALRAGNVWPYLAEEAEPRSVLERQPVYPAFHHLPLKLSEPALALIRTGHAIVFVEAN